MAYNHVVDNILCAFNGVYGDETEEELLNSEEYLDGSYRIIDCPICKSKTMDTWWICSGCGWEHDDFVDYENDDEFSDCNGATLGEYKNAYRILKDAFEKRKNGEIENFYVITCYMKDFSWETTPAFRTYGTFDSFESCRKALNENLSNMHGGLYDFAVAESIDIESNVKEIKWFVWSDAKQGFFETDREADWSDGWVKFKQ